MKNIRNTSDATKLSQKAEEALLASEKKYREVVESASDIIFTTDANGNFTYVNRAGLHASGYSLDELVKINYLEVVLPEDRKRLMRFYFKQRSEKIASSDVEYRLRKKEGEIRWFSQNATFIIEKNEVCGMHVVARDITERKRADDALKQSVSLLQATLESTADGILVVDKSGKITSYNNEFAKMWRIPDDVVASRDDDRALSHVLGQLKYPDHFISKVKDLYAHPDESSFDVLEFKDER